MTVEDVIQGPGDVAPTMGALKGKAVVLEFWATWCGPCVAAVPHLNELVRAFESEDVVFISITKENDPELIRRFLKAKPMESWVAIDADGSIFDSYGISSIPRTILIDKAGKIAGMAHPSEIGKTTIENLLSGQRLELEAVEEVKAPTGPEDSRMHPGTIRAGLERADDEPSLFHIELRPAYYANLHGAHTRRGNQLTGLGLNLEDLLRFAYGVTVARSSIAFEPDAPEASYDLIVSFPEEFDEAVGRQLIGHAIEASFGLRARTETRDVDAYVVSAPSGPAEGFVENTFEAGYMLRSGSGELTALHTEMESLVSIIEGQTNVPVIDETGLDGFYDFNLSWDAAHPESIIEALSDQLGFTVKREKRPIEVLLFERKDTVPHN
jgi:uncharacterized protein (TIGR03435 family)